MASSVLHVKLAEAMLLQQHLLFKMPSVLEEKNIQRRGANKHLVDKAIFVKVTKHIFWLSSVVDIEISVKKCICIDSSYLNKTQKALTVKCLHS